jgi:hypothetical protein
MLEKDVLGISDPGQVVGSVLFLEPFNEGGDLLSLLGGQLGKRKPVFVPVGFGPIFF